MQGLAGHKPRVVRGQKNRRVRNFLRAAHAPEGNCPRRLGELGLAAPVTRLGGVGQSGRDGIDPDPVRASSSAIARVIDNTPPLLAT